MGIKRVNEESSFEVVNPPTFKHYSKNKIFSRLYLFSLLTSISIFIIGVGFFLYAHKPLPQPKFDKIEVRKSFLGESSKKVSVGIYVNRLYGIDLNSGTFSADFYLWFRWKGEKEEMPFEFMNVASKTIAEFTDDESNYIKGENYRGYRVTGNFLADFDLKKYPFDQQILPIIIEDTVNESKDFHYVMDSTSALHPGLKGVGDWQISQVHVDEGEHTYFTAFGDPKAVINKTSYSKFTLNFKLNRLVLPYLLRSVLPLIIILFVAGLIFFINPKESEVRSGVSVTSLLSVVALHMTAGAGLPSIGYNTILDGFFLVAYCLIMLAIFQMVLTMKIVTTKENTAIFINRVCGACYPMLMVIGLLFVGFDVFS